MGATITDLPIDVLAMIFNFLDEPKDRANFAMMSKKILKAFQRGTESVARLPDHRPHLFEINELRERRSSLRERIKLINSSCVNITLGTGSCCCCLCVSFTAILVFLNTCACCTVTTLAEEVVGFSAAGTGGCAAINGSIYGIIYCRNKQKIEEENALNKESNEIGKQIKGKLKELPQLLEMDDEEENPLVLYQSGEFN